MESAKLDKLPFETLQQIGGYLHDTHRPSLYTFGLASKICHTATLRSVFREVHLTVRGRKALQYDVDALVKLLSDVESAQYVRHLGIKGFLPWNIDESDEACKDARTSNVSYMDWFRRTGVAEVLGDEEPALGGYFFLDKAIEISAEEDIGWTPVVYLIKTLPHLAKLVYDCRNQFPPSLLNALHKHHPQCKLYHLSFRLRSLQTETHDPHEMAIATSPCLHSVKVRYAWRDSNGEDDFHEEALPELVAGLAPNLKEVQMVRLGPQVLQGWSRRHHIARELWRGLPGFTPGRGIGLLTSLSLVGQVDFKLGLLKTWNQSTDFSSLNYLALGGGLFEPHEKQNGVNGEVLEWIAQNCCLPQLKTLRIRLDRDDSDDMKPNYANNAITFFKALEPLSELSVDGPLETKILDAILSRHGHALRKLSLCPFEADQQHIAMIFEKEHVLHIQAQCLALQDLTIQIKRTKSDLREAEIYRSFSKMECLQVLFLILDCSNLQATLGGASTDPLFDEDDREFYSNKYTGLKKGYIRETFINCAVDEMLARSIWETIYRDKVGKQLESLKLYTTGGGDFGNDTAYNDIPTVVENLSRFWLIEKSVRDDEDIIDVKELGLGAREARDKQETDFCNRHCGGDTTGSSFPDFSAVHIFRRIWPSKAGSEDWRQDWTSFPLPS